MLSGFQDASIHWVEVVMVTLPLLRFICTCIAIPVALCWHLGAKITRSAIDQSLSKRRRWLRNCCSDKRSTLQLASRIV